MNKIVEALKKVAAQIERRFEADEADRKAGARRPDALRDGAGYGLQYALGAIDHAIVTAKRDARTFAAVEEHEMNEDIYNLTQGLAQ